MEKEKEKKQEWERYWRGSANSPRYENFCCEREGSALPRWKIPLRERERERERERIS